jgi:FOG: EAL domain
MHKEKPESIVLTDYNSEITAETINGEALRRALEHDEFALYYQPQINSRSGCLVGMEALLRWNHPDIGFISPHLFIPIAEKTGRITEIGDWVLYTACRQRKIWNDMGFVQVPVAVNMSACQLQSRRIIGSITEILLDTGLESKLLELEITESSAINNLYDVADILKHLKQLRLSVAIDDFGTGNAAFDYLRMFPLDTIKIDKTFVDSIGVNTTDEAILRSMISLITSLNLRVVAEGVEKKNQIDFLLAEGCEIIQGFYYYKPMPAQDIQNILEKEVRLTEIYPVQHSKAAPKNTGGC